MSGTRPVTGAPDYLKFVLAAETALLGDDGWCERRSVLAETPETEAALIAADPPDAPLFELTRRAALIWANEADPVRRARWAKALWALVDQCFDAAAIHSEPNRARAEAARLNAARRERARGRG